MSTPAAAPDHEAAPEQRPRSPGARLRALLKGPRPLVMPGVHDGFSARLVESMGFAAASISGAGLSESHLGWADMGIMGYRENRDASEALAQCCGLALIGDGDTGYGNALNVHFTVRGFERAGLAGLMIEDQLWPKRCGHLAGKEVIGADEMVQKVRAAVAARQDPDFVIKARTDAAATHGVEEAIRRANLYAEAGADIVFADALRSAADIERFTRAVAAPVAVNMGFGIQRRPTTPLIPARDLASMGVAMVLYPRLLSSAAVHGMRQALSALCAADAAGEVVERPDLQVDFATLNTLTGIDRLLALEQRFLTDEQRHAKYGSDDTAVGAHDILAGAGGASGTKARA